MKLAIDNVVRPGQPDAVNWGLDASGAVTVTLRAGGQQVVAVLDPQDAKEMCCAGIHAAYVAATARQQAEQKRIAGIIVPNGGH